MPTPYEYAGLPEPTPEPTPGPLPVTDAIAFADAAIAAKRAHSTSAWICTHLDAYGNPIRFTHATESITIERVELLLDRPDLATWIVRVLEPDGSIHSSEASPALEAAKQLGASQVRRIRIARLTARKAK